MGSRIHRKRQGCWTRCRVPLLTSDLTVRAADAEVILQSSSGYLTKGDGVGDWEVELDPEVCNKVQGKISLHSIINVSHGEIKSLFVYVDHSEILRMFVSEVLSPLGSP
ncbi:hypothetical protein PoB_004519400 [Plakobranchus ocellatus]|uniref:Uncharacterized protein n=1 Tax=Plakobranchus ocellatus TaxID=259542 RepID=A0AAV4BK55_9GAST|nr:hypothetical protein PoB_004519400 [Plakobranchus ocellatus]